MHTAYSKQLLCLQQQMVVLLTTSLQLSTKLLTLCMHRQNTLKNLIKFWFHKKIALKNSCFQDRKTRKKRQYQFRNCRTDKRWVDMMLAVAQVDLWKKNLRLSRAVFDEVCTELRSYTSPNILSPNHRALPVEKKVAAVLYFAGLSLQLYLKRLRYRHFPLNFAKFLRTLFYRTPLDDCFFKDYDNKYIQESSVYTLIRVVKEVCSAIVINMVPKLIKLPNSHDGMTVV